MKPQDLDINLSITNLSALPQPVSLLGSFPPAQPTVETQYSFDLSGEDFFSVTQVRLDYSDVDNPLPILSKTGLLSNFSIAGVVQILNTFAVGNFYYIGTTVYVNTDFYLYQFIRIF